MHHAHWTLAVVQGTPCGLVTLPLPRLVSFARDAPDAVFLPRAGAAQTRVFRVLLVGANPQERFASRAFPELWLVFDQEKPVQRLALVVRRPARRAANARIPRAQLSTSVPLAMRLVSRAPRFVPGQTTVVGPFLVVCAIPKWFGRRVRGTSLRMRGPVRESARCCGQLRKHFDALSRSRVPVQRSLPPTWLVPPGTTESFGPAELELPGHFRSPVLGRHALRQVVH